MFKAIFVKRKKIKLIVFLVRELKYVIYVYVYSSPLIYIYIFFFLKNKQKERNCLLLF